MKTNNSSKNEEVCLECGKDATESNDLFVCGGCSDVLFCSEECHQSAWDTHRFDCFPCYICGKRVPGVNVHRDCQCTKKKGYAHAGCLVNAAIEDSGGREWDLSSTMWEQCGLCGGSFTGDVKESLDKERHYRVAKAKERLKDLLKLCSPEDDTPLLNEEVISISRECTNLCLHVYGVDNWSEEDVFVSHINLGKARLGCKHLDEARDTLELVQAKLKVHKTKGWRHLVRELTDILAEVYMKLGAHKKLLPLLEDLVHKHYQDLRLPDQCRALDNLASCCTYLRRWKQAREMSEKAYKHSKDVRGPEDSWTRMLAKTRQDIFQSSYNDVTSHGMEGLPDGVTLEIDRYHEGTFEVSTKCVGDENYDDCLRFDGVPVEQVIMVEDSDVVLHSLKVAKNLNGKLGIITKFDHDIGRYKVIVKGSSKTVDVKPQNLLPAYMGCDAEEMVQLAKKLSSNE